ncbi:MAG: glutathione peroxidase [Planctomycetota bacterium]
MPKAALLAAICLALNLGHSANAEAKKESTETKPAVFGFEINSLAGEPVNLAEEYRGKTLLIVNVASRCGLTPQYEGLQALQEKYGDDGFVVLGFPCNQFMGQEPGTADQIQEFCKKNYGVTFDLFEKIEVNGEGAHELYQYLTGLETKPQGPGKISWNFEKFLVDREGSVAARFSPRTKPDDAKLVAAIEAALAAE